MERDWARLGHMVKAERLTRDMTQIGLAEAVGVSLSTIQTLERGARTQPKVLPVHRAVARAIGWTEASVEAVLAGGDPTPTEPATEPVALAAPADENPGQVDELLDDLTERVRQTLLGGKVADAAAIDLGSDDPDAGVVLIWKRGDQPNLTPEQLLDVRRKWARLQRAAHEIFAEDEPGQ
ncbi:helix-turn-helix domain-containing protein [Kitasatospora sp. NPDC001175]|uniref:helix-turn-helix domain-containing protein n=1 Tax=Kitasatospora sp. NPDC001175 TaxID=3157103 RepID=UPI003D055110